MSEAPEIKIPKKRGQKSDMTYWFRNRGIPNDAKDCYLFGNSPTGKPPPLSVIARHLGISHDHVKNISRRDGWTRERERLQKRLKASKENHAARLVEQQMDQEQRAVSLATALLDRLENAITSKDFQFVDLSADKLVAAFDALNRLIRRNMGMPERSSDARAKKAWIHQYNMKIARIAAKLETDPTKLRAWAVELARVQREMIGEVADIEMESTYALVPAAGAKGLDGEPIAPAIEILPAPPVDPDDEPEEEITDHGQDDDEAS